MKTDIFVFDVGLGQSIFIYPHSHPEYGMMIDCGNTTDFNPIDYLIEKGYIGETLNNLTLTNYDQDHFSGLPYLSEKVGIYSVNFAKNLSSDEIKGLKTKPHTNALVTTCEMKDLYTGKLENYNPPYIKRVFHLEKSDLENYDTNNLSQVVFIEHNGTVICIPGDIEEIGWKMLLKKHPEIKDWLKKTNILVASHHGRENGYCSDIFSHCGPECVIISDKWVIHDTQEDMCSVYGRCVKGDGISFLGDNSAQKRKVLTTRNDGHVFIQLFPGGSRYYSTFSHE
jgi:beta-lactamase superfamily II metal-dependent hydrolase